MSPRQPGLDHLWLLSTCVNSSKQAHLMTNTAGKKKKVNQEQKKTMNEGKNERAFAQSPSTYNCIIPPTRSPTPATLVTWWEEEKPRAPPRGKSVGLIREMLNDLNLHWSCVLSESWSGDPTYCSTLSTSRELWLEEEAGLHGAFERNTNIRDLGPRNSLQTHFVWTYLFACSCQLWTPGSPSHTFRSWICLTWTVAFLFTHCSSKPRVVQELRMHQ